MPDFTRGFLATDFNKMIPYHVALQSSHGVDKAICSFVSFDKKTVKSFIHYNAPPQAGNQKVLPLKTNADAVTNSLRNTVYITIQSLIQEYWLDF